jgi:hypothetical protein
MNSEDVPKVFGEAALLDSQIRSMCAFDTPQSMIKHISGDTFPGTEAAYS